MEPLSRDTTVCILYTGAGAADMLWCRKAHSKRGREVEEEEGGGGRSWRRCGFATSTPVSDDENIVDIVRKVTGECEVEATANDSERTAGVGLSNAASQVTPETSWIMRG